jgi:hypothetical protein
MSTEQGNKAIVSRWFAEFWEQTCNLDVVDEIAAPDMLLKHSLHEPRNGHTDIEAFMTDFRAAFPDLNFWGAADLIAKATDCGFPALPGLRARPIKRRLRNCRVEAVTLSREREFYRSIGMRNHGANRAAKIRHRMPGLRYLKWRKLIIVYANVLNA